MTFFPVIGGPIAPYSNVPIAPQNYQPSQFDITALSYGVTTTVTMANSTNNVAPNYVVGQEIRLNIPEKYGANQLNGKSGFVISIPSSSQVEVAINSIGTNPFIASPAFQTGQSQTPAQIIAIGDIGNGKVNSAGRTNQSTFIPGSFINVSP